MVSNQHRAEFEIELKNGKHVLRFDAAAMAALERMQGDGIGQGIGFLAAAISCGLRWRDKMASPDKVLKQLWMSEEWLAYYGEVVTEAIKAAMDADQEVAPSPPSRHRPDSQGPGPDQG